MIRKHGEEQPYINLKLFKLRIPGIHYSLEMSELTQGFICARLAMEFCKTDLDRGVAGFMAVILFTKGAAYGLIAGIILHLLLIGFKKDEDTINL